MKTPVWLTEFHRQWRKNRGARWQVYARAFDRNWEDLLESSGLKGADQYLAAEKEAGMLEQQGRIKLQRKHKSKHAQIKKVILPLESETWLTSLFEQPTREEFRAQMMNVILEWKSSGHPRLPESWDRLCGSLEEALEADRGLRPFSRKSPDALRLLLSLLHGLTASDWSDGVLLRDVSKRIGSEAKDLEKHHRSLNAALTKLFSEPATLESLGIICSNSQVHIQGPLTLHFADKASYHSDSLRGATTLSYTDLLNATVAVTSASRLLSIENSKSTFVNFCAANLDGGTLLLATSHPNSATLRLLELLPADLPHYHFGDTDASGYAILQSLRQRSRRPVQAFHMDWRDDPQSRKLSEHDLRLLPSLLQSSLLTDCRPDLVQMQLAGRKGNFEQEGRTADLCSGWPFLR